MKLAAITNRGSKKDFIDLALLIDQLDLRQMMNLYHEKYPDGMEMMVLKSLVYFDDADIQPDPLMLVPYDWKRVKKSIVDESKLYLKQV